MSPARSGEPLDGRRCSRDVPPAAGSVRARSARLASTSAGARLAGVEQLGRIGASVGSRRRCALGAMLLTHLAVMRRSIGRAGRGRRSRYTWRRMTTTVPPEDGHPRRRPTTDAGIARRS